MESSQLPEVLRRTDVISYALLAEINHFHSERTVDFKLAMQNYLREQTVFYQKVCKLCSAYYVPCCQGIVSCSVGGGCQTSPNDTPAFIQEAPEADCCRLEQPAHWSNQFHEVWNCRCTILVPWFLTLKRHLCVLSFKQLQFRSIVQLISHSSSGMVSSNFVLLWTRQLTCTFNSLLSFLLPALCIIMPKCNLVYLIWVCSSSSQWNL